MTTYNHAFSLAFEIGGSTDPDGGDITAEMIRKAITRRITEISDDELVLEAVGCPWDTHEEDA